MASPPAVAAPPMSDKPRSLPRTLEMLARATAEAAAFLGAAVMAGWILDVPLLRAGVPGAASVKFNAALAFVAAGLAARVLASRRTGRRTRRVARLPSNHPVFEPGRPYTLARPLPENLIVVQTGVFCGKVATAHIYLHDLKQLA